MKKKQPVYIGLDTIPVYYTDTSELSPELFVITSFPTELTAGKNILKLRGKSENLRSDATLNVEILDSNNEPIYHEATSYIDEDLSRVISIYIYPDTPPGDAYITLTTEATQIFGQPVPKEWRNIYNVKWIRKTSVNPSISNSSEIIFETLPTVYVSEYPGVQLNRNYTTSQHPIYNSGSVSYLDLNSQPILLISGGAFIRDMVGGTLTVSSPTNPLPKPYYDYTTPPYIVKIKKVLSDTALLLDLPYLIAASQSFIPHQFTRFDNSAYSIEYTATPIYSATQNSESFALVKIDNLEQPLTGDISRIKVFINNAGTVGTWEQVSDIELEETEIFVTSTASLIPDKSIGFIDSQTTINTYYTASIYNGKNYIGNNTITYNTSNLNNSMYVSSVNNSVTVLKAKDLYNGSFIKNSRYKITLDAVNVGSNAKVSVYLSGSSFNTDLTDQFNQKLPVTVGRKIGELDSNILGNRIDDYIISFSADNNGTAVLVFVIETGNWYISDIRTTSDNDIGYTPNYTRIRTLIPTAHKADVQLNFKIEYYNIAGNKCKQVNYINNVPWLGGNRYIDGEYSMLTGSLYVADSLFSGIGISGYKNTGYVRSLGYSGFDAGFPGFLLYSGSALGGALSKGIPYSGVGLELYASTSSYFRYSTRDNELDIRTDKMYIGNNNTFISASNGKLQISSSNFTIDATGAVSLTGTVNIASGTGFATPASVSASINSATGSLSSSLNTTITGNSSSLAGSITSVSSSLLSTSSSINTKITSVSSSLSASLAAASASLSGTITSNSSSAALSIQATSDRIVTDANNKIIKTNNTPIGGPGLFLSSNYLGYYNASAWNAYMSASGEFLFKKDDNNLMSFGNSAFILKVSDQATISGSNINLLTPRFFFGGTNQYISGSDGKIAISSSNFYLDNAGNVTLTGVVNISSGTGFATPSSVSSSLNAATSSLSSSLNTTITSNSSSAASALTSVSSSISSSLSATSSSLNSNITSVSSSLLTASSSLNSKITSVSSSFSSSLASTSASLNTTIFNNSSSAALSIQATSDRIVTDANNKIIKTNDTPGGSGLFLSSKYLGYYNSPNWNAYISSSGEFLFKKDDNNLMSFANNSMILKVSDTVFMSGSQISLLTPNFFFGGTNQYISGSGGNISISSSKFHLDAAGNVTLTGNINILAGSGFATPASVSSSINAATSSLSSSFSSSLSSTSASLNSNINSVSSSLLTASSSLNSNINSVSSSLSATSSSLNSRVTTVSSSIVSTIVTNANNKIIKPNNIPTDGTGLYLTSNYLGYYQQTGTPGWNSYMSASGEFLFKKDDNNQISFGNNSMILKVSDTVFMSGSQINLITPRFFFGGTNQYISGSDGKIAISSSNFYLDNAGNVTLTGNVNIQSGTGFATPSSVSSSINSATGSLSSSLNSTITSNSSSLSGTITSVSSSLLSTSSSLSGTITSNSASLSGTITSTSSSLAGSITSVSSSLLSTSSSLAGSITSVSSSLLSTSSSINTKITSVSSSLSASLASASSSLSGTITSNSQSSATSFTTAFGRIVTDANNKITKTNDAPGGSGLFLSSNYLGYYNSPNWNAYISASGEFLFQKDTNNLISFGNNAFTLKVSDTATISGSNINLITPRFFFGGVNQYISGSNGNIAISSSNFHLASNGDVIVSGVINIRPGSSGVATPASVSASLNAATSSLSSSLNTTITSNSSSLAGSITSVSSSLLSTSSSLAGTITSNSSSLAGSITSVSSSLLSTSSSLAGSITSVSSSLLSTSSSINTKITSVSSSLSASLAAASSSLAGSITSVSSSLLTASSSLASSITSVSSSTAARIITDTNNKIIKVNDIPLGAGLNLTANYLGYYRTAAPAGWNAYISASGEFLFKKDDNNLMSFGNSSMILKVSDTVVMSGSNINLITPRFFFGNETNYISGSNGKLEISSSNFSLNAQGAITASNIDISGVSLAGVIRNKSVIITTANSSSYLEVIPHVESGGFLITPAYYVLCLNGKLGGQLTQHAVIACNFPNRTFSGLPSVTYRMAIGGLRLPAVTSGQTSTATIEVSGSGIYIRDNIGSLGWSGPVDSPPWGETGYGY